MRLRIVGLFLGILAAALLMSGPHVFAMQSYIGGLSNSNCTTISAEVTLNHTNDDGGGNDRYWFRVFDGNSADLLVHLDQTINRSASPYFAQIGPLPAAPKSGLYRVEVWDVDAQNNPIRAVDQVFNQCGTNNSWRTGESFPQPVDPEIPQITCHSYMPIYSVNFVPRPGAVIAVWSYGKLRTDDEFLVNTWRVKKWDRLYESRVQVPCGVYVRLYYQPDDTKELIFLRSQYHPNDDYGTPAQEGKLAPWYTTAFPSQ